MKMIIGKVMAEQVKEHLTANPLIEQEIRKIPGMGELYASFEKIDDNAEYKYMYTLEIDGKAHRFYARHQQ